MSVHTALSVSHDRADCTRATNWVGLACADCAAGSAVANHAIASVIARTSSERTPIARHTPFTPDIVAPWQGGVPSFLELRALVKRHPPSAAHALPHGATERRFAAALGSEVGDERRV